MVLEVDQKSRTILGVEFPSVRSFKSVWYAVSSNMIEGWEPTEADIIRLRDMAVTQENA